MSSEYDQVIKLLGRLSDTELSALANRLKALRGIDKAPANAPAPAANADADLVLEAICSTMQGCGIEFTLPGQLKLTPGYNAFVDKVPALMQFIRQGAPTRNQQRVLLSLGIRLLYGNITALGYPASTRHLMAQIHRLPSVVDAAFPGYARSGLLGMLISSEERTV